MCSPGAGDDQPAGDWHFAASEVSFKRNSDGDAFLGADVFRGFDGKSWALHMVDEGCVLQEHILERD